MSLAAPSSSEPLGETLRQLDAGGVAAVLHGPGWQFTLTATQTAAPTATPCPVALRQSVLHVAGPDAHAAAQRLGAALDRHETCRLTRGTTLWLSTSGALAHDLRNDVVALADLAGLASQVSGDDADQLTAAVQQTVAKNRRLLDLLAAAKQQRLAGGRWTPRAQPLTGAGCVWASDGLLDTLQANVADTPAAHLDTTPQRTLTGWAWTVSGPWSCWDDVDDARLGLCGLLVLGADGDLIDAPDALLLSLPGCDPA